MSSGQEQINLEGQQQEEGNQENQKDYQYPYDQQQYGNPYAQGVYYHNMKRMKP